MNDTLGKSIPPFIGPLRDEEDLLDPVEVVCCLPSAFGPRGTVGGLGRRMGSVREVVVESEANVSPTGGQELDLRYGMKLNGCWYVREFEAVEERAEPGIWSPEASPSPLAAALTSRSRAIISLASFTAEAVSSGAIFFVIRFG